jgi:TolB-like protein
MRYLARAATMLATFAMVASAQAKPVIAVLYFDNNSWGKDAADYEGVGKGIADMLVTDMASNPNLTVVERERVQSILVEQNLTKEKTIAPETAIRLGRIIGAQYMVTGGFTHDGKGSYVLTSRVINVETSQISHPVRLTSKGDDVLGLINQLSTKLNSELKLPALRVGDAAPSTPATPTVSAAANVAASQPVDRPADASAPSAKPAEGPKPAQSAHVAHAPAKSSKKMDIKTAMLYSKALEEQDAGNLTKAAELFRQVVDKFPDYAPARAKLEKVSRS